MRRVLYTNRNHGGPPREHIKKMREKERKPITNEI